MASGQAKKVYVSQPRSHALPVQNKTKVIWERGQMLATLMQNVDDLIIRAAPCCWLAVITPAIEHYGVTVPMNKIIQWL